MADDLDTPRRSNPLKAQHIAAGRKTDPSVMADDLDRVEAWVRGYRRLMQGGLAGLIHTAGTSDSEWPDSPSGYAFVTVDDIDALIAELRSVRSRKPAREPATATVANLISIQVRCVMTRTVRGLYDAMAAAKTVEDMREVYEAELAFQQTETDPEPRAVTRHNMLYVAGYGPRDIEERIQALLREVIAGQAS